MRDEAMFLADMVNNAQRVQRKLVGKTYQDFLNDENLMDAVLRRLGIIGEAANQISTSTRAKVGLLPWDQMVRMKNVLVHVYFGVDIQIAWNTATNDMAPLVVAITEYLNKIQTPGSP
jgi:uncharacterized protein with HEPN domain